MNPVAFIKSQIARARQDATAARVLADWIGSEADPVSTELASSRAIQCINCPGRHNKLDHRRAEPAIAEGIRLMESMRRHITLKTSQDPRLHSCLDSAAGKGCGCYLKLKVWVPIENQSDEPMPHYCWVTKERKMNPNRVARQAPEKKTIAIRRMAAFGDVIMASILADKLKQAGHTVSMFVEPVIAPILRWHPSVSSVKSDRTSPVQVALDDTYERNQERTTKSVPRLFIEAASHQLRIPLPITNLNPRFTITKEEQAVMLERGKHLPRPWIAINHRSQSWPSRSVSELILGIAAKKINGTCIWTHPGPIPDSCQKIHTANFRELMALLSVCDLCVTPDSGPMHAAAAVGCPVVALEQSIPIALRLSPQCDHTVISAPVDCVRCNEWKCPKDEKRPPCQIFDPKVIVEAVNHRLDGAGKVSVVIPVYKNHERLRRCIGAIPESAEVIVALDGDAQVQNLAAAFVPSPGTRTGFGRTCTRGARVANGEFILFLNDDCYLADNAIDRMLCEMKPDVGVVGCLLKYPDGRIQHGGTTRSGDRGGFGHIDHGRRAPSITSPREMEFVTFAAALVRRKAFFDVGAFDEDYDTYCEDSDLCLRLRKAGWKVMYTPHASGIHDESQTTGPIKAQLWQASAETFHRKWAPYFAANPPGQLGHFKYP